MKYYAIYNKNTGEIVSQFMGNEQAVLLQLTEELDFIESDKTELDGHVVDKSFVAYSSEVKALKFAYPGIGRTWSNQTMSWVDNRTDQQIANEVRQKRDLFLVETDWTQLPDVPTATKELWGSYRQALRDIPQQEGFPKLVTWPEKP